MTIKKIKLKEGGLKGATIVSLSPNEKSNRTLTDKDTKECKQPIHFGMEKPFKDLRFHLLEIVGVIKDEMTKHDVDQYIALTKVDTIEIEAEGFVISGTREIFDGKEIPFTTKLIEPIDEYEHYETVQKIIDVIVEEAKVYLRGEAKVTNDEIVVRWIEAGKDKNVDKGKWESMTDEERAEFSRTFLEKNYGAVVMMEEDVSISHEDLDEVSNKFEVSDETQGVKQGEQSQDKKITDLGDVDYTKINPIELIPNPADPIPVKEPAKALEAKEIRLDAAKDEIILPGL